ncbi:MAG: right-handed parallel beta-helix repeat-containing protein, partial [Methanobrevibacter sp.]|nr:right-handed parallel beta-helix repeat-containing protein [Methanobrevibacter sp.]
NGKVTLKINQNTGTYAIKVNYAGDDIEWAPASAQATLKVNKISTKIVASNYAMFIKKATYYKVTLKDSNGNPLSSQKVTIKVNKKTYKVKTNSKGVAKVKLKLKKGKYTVQIRYAGSNKYLASKKTAKITVKKTLKTKLTAPKVTIVPKKSSKYTVTLKDENGNALKKQKLIIKVNGKKYTKKTNSKGQATIKVKFSKLKTYKVKVTYNGVKKYKKSSKTGKIIVKKPVNSPTSAASPSVPQNNNPVGDVKVKIQLSAANRTFSLNSIENYTISLKDSSGQALANHAISYTLDNKSYSPQTDANGQVKVDISSLGVGSHIIDVICPQNDKYESSSSKATITILNKTGVTFIDAGLSSDEIQSILDDTNNPVEFLANAYNDVSLTINKPLNITFQNNTVLNGKANSPVLTINADNFNISNLVINANEGSGIVVNADNVTLKNNTINNNLDQSQMSKYDSGELTIPGNGISLSGANNARISQNNIKSFGNAIFAQDSDNVEIDNNTLSLSNYGINYGLGVKNTQITNNLI